MDNMTTSGLKRPLDSELSPHSTSVSAATNPSSSIAGDSLGSNSIIGGNLNVSNSNTNPNITNGSKRRCTSYAPRSDSSSISPFRDPSQLLESPSIEIAASLQEELQRFRGVQSDTIPVLTLRQAQTICEKICKKLIKDREQKLKDDYDRVLACKLAEQYDLMAKANYINSYVNETTRLPAQLTNPIPTTTPNTSISALAAAFSNIQRSNAVVSSPSNPATPMSNFSSLAASLSANGHPSALATSQLAYNLQQQAVAAIHHHQQTQHQRSPGATNAIPLGPVLLTSNLDEQLATPEALFTLFGVFGDVIRVKILFNKKDNALVQMADANQAQVAQSYLDKQRVFGKNIRVTRSKHLIVQMPRESNQSDAGLTKDFTNSPLHRFKIPGSRNYLNIYPPSNTLHVSNIPPTIEEKDMHKAFKSACGFEFSSFKFFPKDRKMALVKFNSIEHATIALIKMHNYQISDENNLRVSFSKSVMQQ